MKPALILAGPSAVGKTTVMGELLSLSDEFTFLRSVTTRPPRFPGDDEYIYLSEEEFSDLLSRGDLAESMRYGTYAYGTPKSELRRAEREGKYPLLILDLVGIRSVKTSGDGTWFAVYLYDDLSVMEKRLYERELSVRETPAARATYERRVAANRRDYRALPDFAPYLDFVLKNETPGTSARLILDRFLSFEAGAATRDAAEIRSITAILSASAEE